MLNSYNIMSTLSKSETLQRKNKKIPRNPERLRGNTPVGAEGFEPPTLCL